MLARNADKPKNFLVTNYDATAFTVTGTHRYMLSYNLLHFAKTNHFDGFYGFSNRSVDLLPLLKRALHAKLERRRRTGNTAYTHENLHDNFKTSTITRRFADHTKLTCLGVSTPEDLWLQEMGEGYDTKIAPWENKDMDKRKKPKVFIPLGVIRNDFPDQHQFRLTQIAQAAAAAYPNEKITLTFVNDKRKQCNEALQTPNSDKYVRHWPKNVALEVYQHNANQCDDVSRIGEAKKTRFFNAEHRPLAAPGLRQNGLFAVPSHHTMTTRQQAADQAQAAAAADRHVRFAV